jgi:hypothetical protein
LTSRPRGTTTPNPFRDTRPAPSNRSTSGPAEVFLPPRRVEPGFGRNELARPDTHDNDNRVGTSRAGHARRDLARSSALAALPRIIAPDG